MNTFSSELDRFNSDCERIYHAWHESARGFDTEGLLALYALDAVLESPLVPVIVDGRSDGILRGHQQLREFFMLGAQRRPNELVRWFRTGDWLTDGQRLLMWEYPRATPDGDQVDLLEVMEIADGLIQYHRIYWGWRGINLIAPALAGKVEKTDAIPGDKVES